MFEGYMQEDVYVDVYIIAWLVNVYIFVGGQMVNVYGFQLFFCNFVYGEVIESNKQILFFFNIFEE